MKVLLINVVCGIKSTGRICIDIAKEYESEGHTVKIAYGREEVPGQYEKYAVRIGSDRDTKFHGIKTRFFDGHGLGSVKATKVFLKWAEEYNPDLLWLHNIHGYYLNYELLFDWIKSRPKMQVKWTLHDCWAFTGHCSHFMTVNCDRWKQGCHHCIQKREYPSSVLVDRSRENYSRKKAAFCGVNNMTLITPSRWLADLVGESFLREYSVEVHHNTIDEKVFYSRRDTGIREKYKLGMDKLILGVASTWTVNKGLADFVNLSRLLPEGYRVVLIGLNKQQINELPDNIVGIERTYDRDELAEIYSEAEVLFNPTYEDNYPTVNLEAEACGTRVITYDTGGAKETIKRQDSRVIPVGKYEELLKWI